MRGYCGSTRVTEWFDQRQVGEDIRLLMEAQGFTTFAAVGVDLGANVAFHFAAAYPRYVQKLVLLDSVVPGFAPWEALTRDTWLWRWSFRKISLSATA